MLASYIYCFNATQVFITKPYMADIHISSYSRALYYAIHPLKLWFRAICKWSSQSIIWWCGIHASGEWRVLSPLNFKIKIGRLETRFAWCFGFICNFVTKLWYFSFQWSRTVLLILGYVHPWYCTTRKTSSKTDYHFNAKFYFIFFLNQV